MSQLLPTRLLTTRLRTGLAFSLTAFALALTIVHWSHTKSGWLFTYGWHGWLPIGLDVFFYCYLCWLGFWFIRGTVGPERLFMVGWFASILLSPLEALRPQWAVVKHIGTFGLAVALLAALSLLLKPSDVADSDSKTNAGF
jgi:hypothetical protein